MTNQTRTRLETGLGLGLCLGVALLSAHCAWMKANGGQVVHLASDACLALTEGDTSQEGQIAHEICATEAELRPYVSAIQKKRAMNSPAGSQDTLPEAGSD